MAVIAWRSLIETVKAYALTLIALKSLCVEPAHMGTLRRAAKSNDRFGSLIHPSST